MEAEAAGVVARPGQGGNAAAAVDDDRDQVLGDDSRLLEAERELKTNGGIMISSAVTFMLLQTWISARPPAWVLEARETGGEQQLGARLYEILHDFSMGLAAAVVMTLWLYQAGAALSGLPMAADRTLAAVRLALAALHASVLAIFCLHGSDCWGETAVALFTTLANAAFTWLYLLGKLDGVILRIAKILLGYSSLLEAERELKTNGDAMISSAVILMLLLAWSAAVRPPAWFLAAQETGKQQLRVHLYLTLHVSSMAAAVSTVTAQCRYQEGATLFGRPLAADRILATTRVVLAAIHASVAAICYLRGSNCWGETAVAVFIAWASAAFARLYVQGKLRGFFVMFDNVFGAKCRACCYCICICATGWIVLYGQ